MECITLLSYLNNNSYTFHKHKTAWYRIIWSISNFLIISFFFFLIVRRLSRSLPSSCITSSYFFIRLYPEHNSYCIGQAEINCLPSWSSIQYQLHSDTCTSYLDVCHWIVFANGYMEKIRILDSMGWSH